MRRCGEQIVVRTDAEAPSQFIWRQRLWRVCRVQRKWVEAPEWWRSSGVLDQSSDRVVWRVEAGCGPHRVGVYELAESDGVWSMRTVFD